MATELFRYESMIEAAQAEERRQLKAHVKSLSLQLSRAITDRTVAEARLESLVKLLDGLSIDFRALADVLDSIKRDANEQTKVDGMFPW